MKFLLQKLCFFLCFFFLFLQNVQVLIQGYFFFYMKCTEEVNLLKEYNCYFFKVVH